jgi:simple sugar transport system ATP-binding protein
VDSGVAYVPEDRLSDGLFFGRTIAGNVLSARIGTSKRLLMPANADAIASGALADMRVDADGGRLVEELSGGNQQRVILGRWLLTKPRVLLLNGPTVGVDVGAKAEIHKVIRRLAEEEQLGVLIISDDVDELLHNCNRIVIMHRGRIVEEFETGALREEDISGRLRALP